MDHIKNQLKKRLAQKRLTKQSVWAFILHLLRRHTHYPEETMGKLQWTIFTLRVSYKEDKTALFHKRLELVRIVNTELETAGYEVKVSEIRVK